MRLPLGIFLIVEYRMTGRRCPAERNKLSRNFHVDLSVDAGYELLRKLHSNVVRRRPFGHQ